MLEKTFDPKSVEPRLYQQWEASGAFAPRSDKVGDGAALKPFSIVIPPPNVTGSLHVGHALNNTLQDVLTRFHRMRGEAALWLPGTDHAGIATQMVVERQLAAAGNVGRREMGREKFVEKIWEWKAESGGTIVRQLRRLGASCDWSRERFTLDDGLSAAVRKVFVTLHKQGLIYRDKRLVNWHPGLQTAISDLEVENVEVNGHMWRFRYPIEGSDGDYIVVATTRPETMLGDTAVAVHPGDERYTALVGKQVRLPLTGRLVPIVADNYADPEKGTGAVKITPAHDFNDFQVGKRHNLPLINIFTPEAKMNDEVPELYRGMDRFEARKRVVADIEALGLLDGVENHRLMQPFDEKSKLVVIEPYLTDQWYVDAATLAKPAIAAVEDGRTVIEPKNWEKTYFEWLRNIEPWCISRQLWWGHRIPAWYGPDGFIFVEETESEALHAAVFHYGKSSDEKLIAQSVAARLKDDPTGFLRQDEDVLDTWFSSALWPFSTLGWPEKTADVARFYPTSVLITAGDIIFFWVARMMMMGLHFMGEVPFKTVFLNALVLDDKGQKMSKVKGNVIDPLELIDAYGADALRFTMVAITGQTRHVRLSRQRVEGYRNFGTKLWNAARFCQMHECVAPADFDPSTVKQTTNRWIRSETVKTVKAVTHALENRAFDDCADALYRFIWNVFCDWYVELSKPVLNGDDAAAKAETRATAAWTLEVILKLLHPVSPFITEELWDKLADLGHKRNGMLITSVWPVLPEAWIDPAAEDEVGKIINVITEPRTARSELNVPPSARPALYIHEASPENIAIYKANSATIMMMARVSELVFGKDAPPGSVSFVVDGGTMSLPVSAHIDVAAEKARLGKEIAALMNDAERTRKKLDNPDFIARAPEEVVEENRERLAEAEAAQAKLRAALERLQTVG